MYSFLRLPKWMNHGLEDGLLVTAVRNVIRFFQKGLNRKRKLKIGYFVACLFGAKYKWNFLRKNKVFAYLGKLRKEGRTLIPVSINVSRLHAYDEKLTETLLRLREEYDVLPEYVPAL